MNAQLAHIRRHPIKSIGGEDLAKIRLAPARRLPGDREWAVLTEAGERHAEGAEPESWLPKSCFMRGAASLPLQAISGGWQGENIALTHPDRPPLEFDPAHQGRALLDWLAPLWPGQAPRPTRLIRGAGIWTDNKWPWISILSLDSLAELERRTARPLGIARWRGNLWGEGWQAGAEAGLIGQIIRIGDTELRVTQPIRRCEATCADTATGRADIDMVATLQQNGGDSCFGLYAEVVSGGQITIGDEVRT